MSRDPAEDPAREEVPEELEELFGVLRGVGQGEIAIQLFRVPAPGPGVTTLHVRYVTDLPNPLPPNLEAWIQEICGAGDYEVRLKVKGKIKKKVRLAVEGRPGAPASSPAGAPLSTPPPALHPAIDYREIERAAEERMIRILEIVTRGNPARAPASAVDPERAISGYVKTLQEGIALGSELEKRSRPGPAVETEGRGGMVQDLLAIIREAGPLLAYVRGAGAPPSGMGNQESAPNPVALAAAGAEKLKGPEPMTINPAELVLQFALDDLAKRHAAGEDPASVAAYAENTLPPHLFSDLADDSGDNVIRRVQELSRGREGREGFFHAKGIDWIRAVHSAMVALEHEEEG